MLVHVGLLENVYGRLLNNIPRELHRVVLSEMATSSSTRFACIQV